MQYNLHVIRFVYMTHLYTEKGRSLRDTISIVSVAERGPPCISSFSYATARSSACNTTRTIIQCGIYTYTYTVKLHCIARPTNSSSSTRAFTFGAFCFMYMYILHPRRRKVMDPATTTRSR